MRMSGLWPGAALAIASAVLFGAGTPVAKQLLGGGVDPWLLAALLYLGLGIGLALVLLWRALSGGAVREASLAWRDLPWLLLVVASGGIAGPLLLMLGLARVSASAAALLLNLESVATLAIAWLVFKEGVDRRLLAGALAILAGAGILSWQGGAVEGGWGAVLVAGACLAWGIDNNLTRKLSAADPVQIAAVKGLVAGSVNLVLALSAGASLPGAGLVLETGVVGLLSYGVSLVFFVLALRHLGAARTGAYFSSAPFIGAVVAVAALGEAVTAQLLAAGVLMAIGLYLHLAEHHEHDHVHEALEHDHRHVHDEHHRHDHDPADPPGEPHSHPHRHEPLVHRHPHYPDLHHRHAHGKAG